MSEDESQPESLYRAGDMLQLAATISGITLALATFYAGQGPKIPGTETAIISVLLLFAGFISLYGSGCAILDLYEEHPDNRPIALSWITGSLFVTGAAYVFILVDLAP